MELGYVSAIDSERGEQSGLLTRTAATVVHADQKLTAFRKMERAIHEFAVSLTL